MFERLELLKQRFDELNNKMADPQVMSDQKTYRELVRERSSLEEVVSQYDRYVELERQQADARELLAEEKDPEMAEFLGTEVSTLEDALSAQREKLKVLLLPADEMAGRDVIAEIRAGTGGDEAALFAGDLFRMYSRYAENHRWKLEQLSSSPSDMGGFKEIIFSVKGRDAWQRMKFESGVHRVQRVPATESGGRIHTSTATVAVLPEADDVEVTVGPADLKIDVFRSTGPGGQSVNTTDSAVRVTHKPSGLVVTCQDEKSQLQNKERALRILRARLFDQAQAAQDAQVAAQRRSQVGTGDRAQKVRTYNFPQGRVTDHRVGLTSHRIEAILQGELDEFTEALEAQDKADQLATAEI
jgi:peptide chain release factor 1